MFNLQEATLTLLAALPVVFSVSRPDAAGFFVGD